MSICRHRRSGPAHPTALIATRVGSADLRAPRPSGAPERPRAPPDARACPGCPRPTGSARVGGPGGSESPCRGRIETCAPPYHRLLIWQGSNYCRPGGRAAALGLGPPGSARRFGPAGPVKPGPGRLERGRLAAEAFRQTGLLHPGRHCARQAAGGAALPPDASESEPCHGAISIFAVPFRVICFYPARPS